MSRCCREHLSWLRAHVCVVTTMPTGRGTTSRRITSLFGTILHVPLIEIQLRNFGTAKEVYKNDNSPRQQMLHASSFVSFPLLLMCLCTSWSEQTKPSPQWIQSYLAGIISNQSRLLTSWAWALLWKLFTKTLKPLFKRRSGRRALAVHGSTALSLLCCLRPFSAATQAQHSYFMLTGASISHRTKHLLSVKPWSYTVVERYRLCYSDTWLCWQATWRPRPRLWGSCSSSLSVPACSACSQTNSACCSPSFCVYNRGNTCFSFCVFISR